MVCAMQYISAYGASEGNIVPEEKICALLQSMSLGDHGVFVREFLSNTVPMADQKVSVYYGTAIRRQHSMNYRTTFERLVELAKTYDNDGLISGTVTNTGFGLYYNQLLNYAPAEISVPADTSKVTIGPDLMVNVR